MTCKFQPLEFKHFTYTDAPVAPTIDYKAAYELQRLDNERLRAAIQKATGDLVTTLLEM